MPAAEPGPHKDSSNEDSFFNKIRIVVVCLKTWRQRVDVQISIAGEWSPKSFSQFLLNPIRRRKRRMERVQDSRRKKTWAREKL
jgi:hypothetical protein